MKSIHGLFSVSINNCNGRWFFNWMLKFKVSALHFVYNGEKLKDNIYHVNGFRIMVQTFCKIFFTLFLKSCYLAVLLGIDEYNLSFSKILQLVGLQFQGKKLSERFRFCKLYNFNSLHHKIFF